MYPSKNRNNLTPEQHLCIIWNRDSWTPCTYLDQSPASFTVICPTRYEAICNSPVSPSQDSGIDSYYTHLTRFRAQHFF